MFGFGKKNCGERLAEERYQKLTEGMSRRERKEFERKKEREQRDLEWEAMALAFLFTDD